MSSKPKRFDDMSYTNAVHLLLDTMKLERLSRGLLSGEKPSDVEKDKSYDIEQLLDEFEKLAVGGTIIKG
jgi:hypothetical protein